MTALTLDEQAAWRIRVHLYWISHPYRCVRCNRPGGDRWWRPPCLLQVHHLWYTVRGEETDDQIIGLCVPCHQLIHRRHRRHARNKGWMRGNTVTRPEPYYATLPRFTRRWVRIGRALAWRDGFPTMGRLPELDR
jgi:hypothetical protein